MGLIDVDIILVQIISSAFDDIQGDKEYLIDEAFSTFTAEALGSIKRYFGELEVTNDHRKRSEDHKVLYVLPSHPMIDLPFPQVGVSIGNESTSEHFIGDDTGEDGVAVYDKSGNLTGWDVTQTLAESGSWQIDILAETKMEIVWIAKIIKLSILRGLEVLDSHGIKEIDLVTEDIEFKSEQRPAMAFARRITVQGKVFQTWTKRFAAGIYQTGVNLAQEPKP